MKGCAAYETSPVSEGEIKYREDLPPKSVKASEIISGLSQSTLERNPHLGHGKVSKNDSGAILGARRGIMNKTEAEFALMLEEKKRNGEILRYEYEGITLRWAGIRYTPDFVVFGKPFTTFDPENHTEINRQYIKLIEVKGPFIKGKFERAIERFRHARTYWPEFSFEMWQKQKSGWKRIH